MPDLGQDAPRPSTDELNALARDIAERRTRMPAYLVDDETFDAALAEAEATWQPPPPKSPLQEAIDRARHPDPIEFINAYNRARSGATGESESPLRGTVGDTSDGTSRGRTAP